MSSPLSRVARKLVPGVRAAGARVSEALGGLVHAAESRELGPALRLSLIDPTLGRRFLEQQAAIAAVLGPDAPRSVGALALAVGQVDPVAARGLVSSVAEQCARVAPPARPRFWAALQGVAAEAPGAVGVVASALPALLARFDDVALASFLAEALALWARSPSLAAGFLRLDGQRAQGAAEALRPGLALHTVQRTLGLYAAAHCGSAVQVRAAPAARAGATDGRHVLLPERVEHFGDSRDFLLYRVWTARAAGFIEFGSLDVDLAELPPPDGQDWPAPRPGELELERFLRGLPNPSLARDLFALIEGARVEAHVRAAYPGVGRDMDALGAVWQPPRPSFDGMAPAEQAVELLHRRVRGQGVGADAATPAAAAAAASAWAALSPLPTAGMTVLASLRSVLAAYPHIDALLHRVDPHGLGPRSGQGGGDGRRDPSGAAARGGAAAPVRGGTAQVAQSYTAMAADPTAAGLQLGALAPELGAEEDAARRLLDRLRARAPAATLQDARDALRQGASFDEVDAQLERQNAPAGPLREPATSAEPEPHASRGAALGGAADTDSAPLPDEHRYPEWDHHQDDLKPGWVRLRERRVLPGDRTFLDAFDAQHGALVGQVRRAFEALRVDGLRPERALVDGDELDMDRVLAERVDRRAGRSGDGRVYSRRRPRDREVAVAFLVDLSSSTNEVVNAAGRRIIEVEKDALLVAVEAVSAMGDACAVWGFSGYGRDQVAFYEAKGFAEPWDDTQRRRVARLGWKMENRDGAAIRHATHKLLRQPARARLLLLVSDGRPLDCGCEQYRDRYAQEDTRAALREARRAGVRPFCITVDPQGPQYLGRVYGEGSYLVIDRVEQLPEKLTAAWRRLRG